MWGKIWYVIGRMRFACRVTVARIQTHIHNTQYLLAFHSHNGYAKAPKCFVSRSINYVSCSNGNALYYLQGAN